jgi:hypothetical protein
MANLHIVKFHGGTSIYQHNEGMIMTKTPQNAAGLTNLVSSDNIRSCLAMLIILLSIGGIFIIGLCAISIAAIPIITSLLPGRGLGTNQSFNDVKDILGILLPVMSAWAGTVLAYYFSKDNFETAARNTAALVQQLSSEEKLKTIVVSDVMIKIEDADKLILANDPKEYKLKADIIDKLLEPKNRERLPIIDTEGRIKYMAHRSLIDKFIAKKASQGKAVDELSLADMLADGDFERTMSKTFCTIRANQNLSVAKGEMEKLLSCADIFITDDGTSNTRVIGWITDAIVSQQAIVK